MGKPFKKMTPITLCLVAVCFKLPMHKYHTLEDILVWLLIQLVTRAKVSVLTCWVGISIASNLVESPDCTPNSFFFCLLNISTISFNYLRRTSTCVHLPFFFHLLIHSFIIFGIYTMFVPGPVFYTRDTTMNKIDVK